MATLTNRSRYLVTVKNRKDLARHFPHDQFDAVAAYVDELRAQHLKPHATQLDESWLVRIRDKGHKPITETFGSRSAAEEFISRVTVERQRGLFIDYTASMKVSFADLIVRFLLEEVPRHKSGQVLAYSLEGWLADSGPQGQKLLEQYREELARRGRPVRAAKFKMRRSSDELVWIHKPLAEVTTVDIETFINDRLDAVAPATVDREIDRLKSIFSVATTVWAYPLATNPMRAVRRPKYFNERDRRLSRGEEARLVAALAELDAERAVEARLRELAGGALAGRAFPSRSPRKKALAQLREELRPQAQDSANVVPYLQVFYYFQVMTAARRGETLSLTWDRIDFEAKTAFLPETKNGRPRKLALRRDLLELLAELPRDTPTVFAVGVDYLVGAWSKACKMADIKDLHIHDVRHEALSRLAESGQFTLPELQAFSGHRDLRMLMRYAHLCASRLAKKLDECFKNDEKVRVHRGRRYLGKAADVRLADVCEDPQETVAVVETASTRATDAGEPAAAQSVPSSQSATRRSRRSFLSPVRPRTGRAAAGRTTRAEG